MFYSGTRARNFGRRFQMTTPYQQIQQPIRRKRNPTKKNKNTFSDNSRTSTVMSFKVYAGSITKEGLIIPVGPDHAVYSATSYYQTAKSYNNYMPIALQLEVTPLLNQTQASSMLNAYLTTDVKATIPKNDVDMKNSTVTHRGAEWFAANRKVLNLPIPQLKQNNYETGSGDVDGNTAYEESAKIIIKPTSCNLPDAVAEAYINVKVKFTGPATPIEAGTVSYVNTIAKDVSLLKPDSDAVRVLFLGNFTKWIQPDVSNVDVFEIPSEDGPAAFDRMDELGDYVKFLTKIRPEAHLAVFVWTADADGTMSWQLKPEGLFNVNVINNVVPAYSTIVNRGRGDYILESTSIPTFNHNVEGQTDTEHVTVDNTTLPVHYQKISEGEPDTPFPIVAAETVPVDVKNPTIDVNVKNKPSVEIDGQPIKVTVEKSAEDEILGVLEGVVGALAI
uniref:Uncharacterized protein n=1 Tax=Robinvale plant virus 1 TaxID=2201325 RepID=A0A2U8JQD9_9VIRU|nr:hypothetical protein [Robinvale plant virus 1]